MKKISADAFQKAKNYCFLLLKFRLRSEQELCSRLKKKKFDEPIIRKALDFLKEKKFIDDAAFVQAWVESRIKRGFGLRRIIQELALKGIDKRLIESAEEDIKENYPQRQMALAVASKRMEKLEELDPEKIKSRIYGYLLRRGFSPDIVIDVVDEL